MPHSMSSPRPRRLLAAATLLLAAAAAPLAAQTGTLSGRVTDAGSGEPIAGASVRVAGRPGVASGPTAPSAWRSPRARTS